VSIRKPLFKTSGGNRLESVVAAVATTKTVLNRFSCSFSIF
jgi:hypothetical protein